MPFTPSWSQAGEDIVLDLVIAGRLKTGFYVDIGAHDPNRFSVTRKLYDRGWSGLDIDANNAYAEKFEIFRPRNTFLNCCVGFEPEYELHIFDEGAVSTVNINWKTNFQAAGFKKLKTVNVPGIKLRTILDDLDISNQIDFLNIDIEGADEEALRSLEFETLPLNRYPKWILLESEPPVAKAMLAGAVAYAIEFGYRAWCVLPTATLLKAPENNL